MPNYLIVCTYCGSEWKETVWNKEVLLNSKCKACKSKVEKFYKLDDEIRDVFGYRFSPPFPKKDEKKAEDNSEPYWVNRNSD